MKELPILHKFKHAIELFPGLEELDIKNKTRLVTINYFKAFEICRWIGAFDFGNKIPVKACLNFWYKTNNYNGIPVIAEFSFDYNVPDYEKNLLESYPIEIVNNASALFLKMQKRNKFTYKGDAPKTKTKIAYNLI
jgi:hypothetical protein